MFQALCKWLVETTDPGFSPPPPPPPPLLVGGGGGGGEDILSKIRLLFPPAVVTSGCILSANQRPGKGFGGEGGSGGVIVHRR